MILTERYEIRPAHGGGDALFGSTEARCREWVDARPDADAFIVVRQPACSCCGVVNELGHRQDVIMVPARGIPLYRCSRHRTMNPCAVHGCARTRGIANGWYDDDNFLCAEHWKLACPPRSKYRLVYNRIFALVKRRGIPKGGKWPADLERRYWRIWDRIVQRARGETAGDLDMAEINKLFGWE